MVVVFVRKDNIRAAKDFLEKPLVLPSAELDELLVNIIRAKCSIPSLIPCFSLNAKTAPTVKDMLIALSVLHYIHTVPEQFFQPSALAQELSELLPEEVREEFIKRHERLPVPADVTSQYQQLFRATFGGPGEGQHACVEPDFSVDPNDFKNLYDLVKNVNSGLLNTLDIIHAIEHEHAPGDENALAYLYSTIKYTHVHVENCVARRQERSEGPLEEGAVELLIAEKIAFKLDQLMHELMTDRDGERVPESVFVQKLRVISIPNIPDEALQAIAGAYRKVYYGTKDSAEKLLNISVLEDFVSEMLKEHHTIPIPAEEYKKASDQLKQEQQQPAEALGLYTTAIIKMNELSDILVGKAVGSLERK